MSKEQLQPSQTNAILAQLMGTYLPLIQRKAVQSKGCGLEYDDIVQEGLIGLFNAVKNYNPAQCSSFSAFAQSCINNSVTSALRAARRRKHVPLNDFTALDTLDDSRLPASPSAEEIAIAREQCALLETNIEKNLSDFERAVLRLNLRGYNNRSAAAELGASVKSVENALTRARRKLRR